MTKIKVNKIKIEDKIYIDKKDVLDEESLVAAYTHFTGDEFISDIEEYDDHYEVPSNSYYKLDWAELEDNRNFDKLDYDLSFSGILRVEQKEAADKFIINDRARSGILQAPCGFGKTFVGCYLVAKNNSKTLILVHTKLLFRQWIEELEKLIPNQKIGKIGDSLFDIQDITVGLYKTVYNNINTIKNEFSAVFVDECHLCPAEMFSSTLNNINAKVKIGISATPKRKDGKHVFLADYFSPYIIVAKDLRNLQTPSVLIKETDFKFQVMDPKRDWARALNKLSKDYKYLEYVAELAIGFIKTGRCPLILGERVQMLEDLQKLIPNSVCLLGKTDESTRKDVLENMGKTYKALLSTKLLDEGISCHRLDTLVLTCPTNNPIKLEQRIGRVIREHPDKQFPLICDIWLSGAVVARQQKNRLAWYTDRGYNFL